MGRLATMVEATTDIVALCRPDGTLLHLNPAGREQLQLADEASVAGCTLADLFRCDRSLREHAVESALQHGSWRGELTLARGWGEHTTTSVVLMAHEEPDGRRFLSAIARDITGLKSAETELTATLSLLGATLESTADGILVVDHFGRISSFNRRYAEMWRIPDSVLASEDDRAVLTHVAGQLEDPESFLAKVRAVYLTPDAESEDVLEFRDGRVFERFSKPQRVAGRPVGRVWSFRDVTRRQELEVALAHQAFHDPLTGLANRVLLRDRVEHGVSLSARRGTKLAVLFIDLDDFKRVNDSLGHTVGDQLLAVVARRLRENVRSTDTVARLGGDEFAILLEDLGTYQQAEVVAASLVRAIAAPVRLADREIVIGASVGIAHAEAGDSCDQLLRNADLAMYTAKRNGRGTFASYRSEMHTVALERLGLEESLRRAIDSQQLVIHYQPLIDLALNSTVGVEALVRWQHPERGLLYPDAFISAAEESGLILQLGRYVLTEACRQVREWQLARPTEPLLRLSVNVSARQLQDTGFVDDVAAALADACLPAGSLILEITETAIVADFESTVPLLHRLKDLGVALAVDDFGTGYSSMLYLQTFPVDILKIDRAFVATMGAEAGVSLAPGILALATSLGLSAVAEGVETKHQIDALIELGCGVAQGYHFSRPVGADELGRLLRSEARTPVRLGAA